MYNLYYRLLALLGLLTLAATTRAQNVGIGTTTPTQTLDVNGGLRVRGLTGSGARLPQVQLDGTLGLLNTPACAGSAAASPSLLNPSVPAGTAGGTPLAGPPDDIGYAANDPHAIVAVAGSIACIGGVDKLSSYDVSNPAHPLLLDVLTVKGQNQRLALQGTKLYAGGYRSAYLHVVDISRPANLTLQDSVLVPTDPSRGICAVATSGPLVFVTEFSGAASLQIYDTSTGALVRKGSLALANPVFSLAASNALVYVASVGSGSFSNAALNGQLQVIDVSDPTQPVLRGGAAATDGVPHGLAVSGTTVYLLTGNNRLQVFATGANTTPQVLASLPTGSQPSDLVVSGAMAYVVNYGASTLQTFDVSQPASPVFRGQVTTDAMPLGVATDGQVAYVCAREITIAPTLQTFSVNSVRPLGLLADGSLTTTAVPVAPTLALSGQRLSISGGNVVTLSLQTLSFTGTTLGISGGNTVTIPGDNLGNHTATQNLNLATYQLVGQGGSQGLSIVSSGYVGIGTKPSQQLELGGQLSPTLLLHSSGNNQLMGAVLQFRESATAFGWNLRHNNGASEEGSSNDRLILERLNGGGAVPTTSWDQTTGNVGIGTAAPTSTLDVRGAATVSASVTTPKLLTPPTGAHSMVAVGYGTCRQDGTLLYSSENVTVTAVTAGVYVLAVTGSDSTIPYVIQASPTNNGARAPSWSLT